MKFAAYAVFRNAAGLGRSFRGPEEGGRKWIETQGH
jgi:hypothetical protein